MAADDIRVTYTVEGVVSAMKTLRKMEPELAKEYRGLMRAAGVPLQAEARSLIPTQSPLDNWGQWRGGWSSKAKTGVRIKVNTGGKKRRIGVLELKQNDASGAIFDMAGRAFPNGRGTEGGERGANMVARLNRHFGRASRALWPAAEKHLPRITQTVGDIVERMSDSLNKELKR